MPDTFIHRLSPGHPSRRRAAGVAALCVAILGALAHTAFAFNPLIGDYSKEQPLDIRIMSYNTEGAFIANASHDAAFDRIFTAINPDLICLQEIPISVSSTTMAARFNSILPIGGAGWQVHYGLLAGTRNAIVSRYPLLLKRTDTIPASSTRGVTIALADLPNATYPVDVYLLGVHLKCCGDPGGSEDESRQRSADAIANWLGDARGAFRPSGDNISLPANTPMIVLGDFNMVGGPQPESTLLTGDIIDNPTFGADVKGDWDITDITNLNPLDPFTGQNFTWQGSGSFDPSPLDRMMTTDSAFNAANKFILNSDTMTPSARSTAGLLAGDTLPANSSDHLPIVVDLRIVDVCVADADEDGTPDCTDGCPNDPLRVAPGLCGCNVPAAVQGSGDVNRDNVLDGRDIQAFVRELLAPASPSESACAADGNLSGSVTTADVGGFVGLLLSL